MKKHTLFMLFFALLFLTACIKDNNKGRIFEEQAPEQEVLLNEETFLKETSILLGHALSGEAVRVELLNIMESLDEGEASVSFAYLVGNKNKLKKNELAFIEEEGITDTKSVLFLEALLAAYEENKEAYPNITHEMEKLKTQFRRHWGFSPAAMLAEKELQIFYPAGVYTKELPKSTYYTSYKPRTVRKRNEVFEYSLKKPKQYTRLWKSNNNFVDDHPVYGIIPIDDCDFPHRPCDFTELKPVSSNHLPPKLKNDPELLKYNVNHKDIHQDDILSTNIPLIQVNGNAYMRWMANKTRLKFYRASPDGVVSVNPDGSIAAKPKQYLIGYFSCKRRQTKGKKTGGWLSSKRGPIPWLGFHKELDPDWDMSENTQNLVLFSIHGGSSDDSATVDVKSGFKIDTIANGGIKIVPHYEISSTSSIKVSTDERSRFQAVFRANTELSRRHTLVTIIGPGTGSLRATYHYNGVNYNVKQIGIVHFFFEHYYTNLHD